MTMEILELKQGSPEWHQHRASHFNASDAAAVLGVSPYKSRNQLLKETATGVTPEIDGPKQKRFDKGHEYEAMARPWAEEILGEDLYPVVVSNEIEGLPLSASADGLTMGSDTVFEHKTLNQELADSLDEGVIPDHHHPQLEQQLLVTEADAVLFVASAGDRENMRYQLYVSRPELRKQLISAWRQFRDDLATYEPEPDPVEAVGESPNQLPYLRIEVSGQVLDTNLEQFKARAVEVFESISTDLHDDQDFADAESTVKWCKEIEKRLDAAKDHAQSQMESVDELFRAVDEIRHTARNKRLELERLVKQRKDQVRQEIVRQRQQALQEHIQGLERSIGAGMPAVSADFTAAIKGKKTVKSLQDAADQELSQAKIAANETADRMRANLERFRADAEGYETLFADLDQLLPKQTEDFVALVKARIADRKAEEQRQQVPSEQDDDVQDSREAPAVSAGSGAGDKEESSTPANRSTKPRGVSCEFDIPIAKGLSDEDARRAIANRLYDAGVIHISRLEMLGKQAA